MTPPPPPTSNVKDRSSDEQFDDIECEEIIDSLSRLGKKAKEDEDKSWYHTFLIELVKNHPELRGLFPEDDKIWHIEQIRENIIDDNQKFSPYDPESAPYDIVAETTNERRHAIRIQLSGEITVKMIESLNQTIGTSRWSKLRDKGYEKGHLIYTPKKKQGTESRKQERLQDHAKQIESIFGYTEVYDWVEDFPPATLKDLIYRAENDLGYDGIAKPAPLKLHDYQQKAVDTVVTGLKNAAAGQMIMPCGTGKTIVSLRIAEKMVSNSGRILFLVPSIALMDQTIREWLRHAQYPKAFFTVCSDKTVANRDENEEDVGMGELPTRATTDVEDIVEELKKSYNYPHVTFCTYQSLPKIIQAQKREGVPEFDLVIVDEAHKTSGILDSKEDGENGSNQPSGYRLVHNREELLAKHRLYMTATPKVIRSAKNSENDDIFSMDNVDIYGEELYKLDFGTAIELNALTEYEVLVVLHDKYTDIASSKFSNSKKETEDAKIIALWDTLADPESDGSISTRAAGTIGKKPLRKAITYSYSVAESKRVSKKLEILGSGDNNSLLRLKAEHVDGKMSANIRHEKISNLKDKSSGPDSISQLTRVLSNSQLLTEGVDIPSLDAIAFLNFKKSEIDIVQAVGRVMRKADGKEKGYIILPILVDNFSKCTDSESIAKEISSGKDFKLVWNVLKALQAHDERFDAEINSLDDRIINKVKILNRSSNTELSSLLRDEFRKNIKKKLSDSRYWPRWAEEITDHIKQIIKQINDEIETFPEVRVKHGEFLAVMRSTLNAEVSETYLTQMLAQHVVTLPVFNALFGGDSFAQHNPIARAMNTMLDALDEASDTDMRGQQMQRLEKFYKSVEIRIAGIEPEDSESRLKVLNDLYEKFFKTAMRKEVEKLGVAYTPTPLVDFVIRSVDDLCRAEFGVGLTDENVNIIEPFVGTGTFLHRLLTIHTDPTDDNSSYIIQDEDIYHKFSKELHANEILLLAYYMASVKIEEGFKIRNPNIEYTPFNGLVLADTFELISHLRTKVLKIELETDLYENTQRTLRQTNHEMRVIIGNPPWSAGQKDEGDENPNVSYPAIDERISETYAAKSDSQLKSSLFDSYKLALRWATDRINPDTGGVIGFILPNSIVEGNAEAGVRGCIEEEFSSAWVYNLLGDTRKTGDCWGRPEGAALFGSSTRQGVCLLLLVKNPNNSEQFSVNYCVVEDYSKLEEKFNHIVTTQAAGRNLTRWTNIIPDKNYDWINQDQISFNHLTELASKEARKAGDKTLASAPQRAAKHRVLTILYSNGVKTNKDDWLYGYDQKLMSTRLTNMLEYREDTRQKVLDEPASARAEAIKRFTYNDDLKAYKWGRRDRTELKNDVSPERKDNGEIFYNPKAIRIAHYRPFIKTNLYYDPRLINEVYRTPQIFPSGRPANTALTIQGNGSGIGEFSTLATDSTPDLNIQRGGGQVIPRFVYARERSDQSYGVGRDGSVLGIGDRHNTGHSDHVQRSGDSALRVSEHAMTPDNSGEDVSEATDVLPGVELTELTGGDQPDADGKVDNISDWALSHFRNHYSDTNITKDDIWHYIYGALHAQDWRDKYANELTKYLPRIPMAATVDDFREFCVAGETLMALHLSYETIDPWPLAVEIDGESYAGEALTASTHNDPSVYRIDPKMRWAKLPGSKGSGYKTENRSVLVVNGRCQITGIPAVAGNPYRGEGALDTPLDAAEDDTRGLLPYVVNGKTPLEWAIAQLRVTTDTGTKEKPGSGIVNDANQWHVWQADEDAHKLVLHLLRLVRVSVETAKIVASLPAMPLADD